MKAKKVGSFLLGGMMVVSMAGCAGTGNREAEKDNSVKESSAAKTDTADAEEEINLTFWHIWPDAEMSEIVDDYVEMFEEEHPNVHIESVATQEVEYQNNKLKVAAATGAQGDVFMCWGGGYARTM